MKIHMIWAQSEDGAIGIKGGLPWHCPEDLHQFRSLTLGSPLIMGRKTYESLPSGGLPHRLNLVLSASLEQLSPPAELVRTPQQALARARATAEQAVYVIGGRQVFDAFMPSAQVIHITDIDVTVPAADVHAPAVPSCFRTAMVTPWRQSRTGVRFRFRLLVNTHNASAEDLRFASIREHRA